MVISSRYGDAPCALWNYITFGMTLYPDTFVHAAGNQQALWGVSNNGPFIANLKTLIEVDRACYKFAK